MYDRYGGEWIEGVCCGLTNQRLMEKSYKTIV